MPDGSRGETIALHDVRVFDGERLSEPTTVLIDGPVIGSIGGGSIGRAPAGARAVDAAGATLLPGLIDSHVHLHGPQDLHSLAAWGVTTGLDMACWPQARVAALRAALRDVPGDVPGDAPGDARGAADFRTAGLPAIGPDGIHARLLPLPAEAIVRTAADARRHVEHQAAAGVAYIKGIAEAPGQGGPPAEALFALVVAAREHGLKTVVHAASVGAYSTAVASGAEFVTHVPTVGAIADADLAAMRAAGQTAIPTITMMEGILASRAPSTASVEDLLHSLQRLRAAGIPILAGTDANSEPSLPSPVPHGRSLHHELALMVRAGIPAVEVLRAATVLPARAFGLDDRGAVAPGLRADLLLVDGDPTADISATTRIRGVWCAGVQVTPVAAQTLRSTETITPSTTHPSPSMTS